MIRKCISVTVNINFNLDTLVFTDDQVILANSEYKLQYSVNNLQNTANEFYMGISTVKTK
jgi:hypothetical protein